MTKCQQFKSKDEEVELITVEEFYSVAPEEISKREATSGDEHQQKLARDDGFISRGLSDLKMDFGRISSNLSEF